MGKHDEIWQSINELDDRVTRLEEVGHLWVFRARISKLEAECERLRGAIAAQDERELAGTVVYGENFQGLSNFADFVKECDTHTGLIIDVRPIDERKCERRVAKLTAAIHSNVRMNDRRRTAGTRADRKAEA
jgi:hypothetical protein